MWAWAVWSKAKNYPMANLDVVDSPVWMESGLVETAQLKTDTKCDVCVVGAGIAGLLTAERLVAAGMKVVILDAGPVGGGETSHTTAHLVTALDDRYVKLENMHGKDGARIAAESHSAAIDYVGRLIERLGIDCGWHRVDGYLTVNDRHANNRDTLLSAELDASGRAGVAVELVANLPAPWPVALGPALRFARQAQMQPLALMKAVARGLIDKGVPLYTGSRVKHVHGGDNASVQTEGGSVVRCQHVVVATNTPFNNLVAVHTKQAGYQTYVVAFRVPAGVLPRALVWDGLWEDDAAYHYVRLYAGGSVGGGSRAGPGHDLLIVGGEDHRTGQGPKDPGPYPLIEEWTRAHFPMCGVVERTWSGEVMEPADGLAYIGHNAMGHKNVYIVTGDSGTGMTHGAIAAMLIPDLISGRENPWAKLYDPARKIGLHALKGYVAENLNTAAQYRDWLGRGDVKDEGEIKPGHGAIVCQGLTHVAVYKDESGQCTRRNAVCPHLGAIVRWNDVAKTWDCPAHGSRFDCSGKVMHGPANTHLTPHEPK